MCVSDTMLQDHCRGRVHVTADMHGAMMQELFCCLHDVARVCTGLVLWFRAGQKWPWAALHYTMSIIRGKRAEAFEW
jgi:hypothetical protein